MRSALTVVLLSSSISLVGCGKTNEPKAASTEPSSGSQPANAGASVVVVPGGAPIAEDAKAEVGKPAPDFTLTDTDGKVVHLADTRGKFVVLEWFNPDCPFVRKSHEKGSLKGLAAEKTKAGVTWLAINSAAKGKQGNGAAHNSERKTEWSLSHPILLDDTGAVGRAYGATNTPHMYVIDPHGTLVYAGAIDNSPDAEGESPTGGKLVNYVDQALKEVAGGRPVSVASTKAYGCSVKY
jgi:peroxiredoxin